MSGMQPSLEGFVSWLDKQPSDKTYPYYPSSVCAVGAYRKSLGLYAHSDWDKTRWDMEDIAARIPRTFGACAARARVFLAKT